MSRPLLVDRRRFLRASRLSRACRRRSGAAATRAAARSSASRISCCASTTAKQPRAVLVGWDTLDAPTYRHEAFADYQSGRQFDRRAGRPARGSAAARRRVRLREREGAGLRGRRLPRRRRRRRGGGAAGPSSWRAATATRSSSRPSGRPSCSRSGPARWPESAPAEVRERYGVEPRQVPDFIALRGDPSDKLPGARGIGPKGAASLLRKYGSLEEALAAGPLPGAGRSAADSIAASRRWTPRRRCRRSATRRRPGRKPPRSRRNGS